MDETSLFGCLHVLLDVVDEPCGVTGPDKEFGGAVKHPHIHLLLDLAKSLVQLPLPPEKLLTRLGVRIRMKTFLRLRDSLLNISRRVEQHRCDL